MSTSSRGSASGPPWRVLCLIDNLPIGGTERSLLEILRRLDPLRFEVVVCTLYRGSDLIGEFREAGLRVVDLDQTGRFRPVSTMRHLHRLIRELRPHLIHTMLFRADQFGRTSARLHGIRVVSSFVGVPYSDVRFETNPQLSRRKSRLIRLADRLTARWVAAFHAVSPAAADANCRALAIDPGRVTVIARGRADPTTSAVGPRDSTALETELALDGRFPVLLNVGRLARQKGQIYLIEALAEVVAAHPAAVLLIAGEGEIQPELEARAHALGLDDHVRFLGNRSDVPDLLAVADAFVFPSLYEGLPGAVIEAMFAGCPIVAAEIPMLEGVIQPGRTGLLVPPRDARALAGRILELAADPPAARELAQKARAFAREAFDIDRVTQETESFYEHNIGRQSR